MKNFSLAVPILAEHLSRDFTIFHGIFRLFSWIGPLYSRIDLFRRPIAIVGQTRRSTGFLSLVATVSRQSRGILRNNAWFVSHVEF